MSPQTPRKILIDTDPGIDDAMAIFYALESPELEVVGLTSIFGNADIDVTTTNALKLLEIAGRTDIPVARGVDQPLAMPFRGAVTFVHGTMGRAMSSCRHRRRRCTNWTPRTSSSVRCSTHPARSRWCPSVHSPTSRRHFSSNRPCHRSSPGSS